MNLGKIAISFFLLLTYSFGFAHNIIPHQQWFESNNRATVYQEKGRHLHHQHALEEHLNSGHKHVLHGDHYDTGLYNLVVCFFSESEHPANGCEIQYFLPAETLDDLSRDSGKVRIAALQLPIFTELSCEDSTPNYYTDSDSTCLSPPLKSSPHRGPPSANILPTEALG